MRKSDERFTSSLTAGVDHFGSHLHAADLGDFEDGTFEAREVKTVALFARTQEKLSGVVSFSVAGSDLAIPVFKVFTLKKRLAVEIKILASPLKSEASGFLTSAKAAPLHVNVGVGG